MKVIMVCDTPTYGHAPTPNIIDLSGKTKKLWSGQASLRRSRRGDIINVLVVLNVCRLLISFGKVWVLQGVF